MQQATEAVRNIRTVRAFAQELAEVDKHEKSTNEALRLGIRDALARMVTDILSNTVDQSISVLLLLYGGWAVLQNDGLTIGDLITFQLYWSQINGAYRSLTSLFSQFTRAGGAASRVMHLLDSLPDIDVHAGTPIDSSSLRGELQLVNVHFTYPMRPNEPVLRGIDLHIRAGSTVALVGRSGGGKSTIVSMLERFYDPTEGQVLIDGVDLKSVCALDYRRNVGLVSQETQLFAGTIEDNIAYGTEAYTHDDVVHAAKQANAFDFIDSFDEGFDTKIGENGTRLSGGQRQRLAIARMLMRKPRILLLDEATSALDTESEQMVQAAIDQILSERSATVVLVAHRLSTVKNADLIAVVDHGRIVEAGTHDELVAAKGIYHKLVARQLVKDANVIDQGKSKKKKASLKDSVSDVDALMDEIDEDEGN